MVRRFTAGLLFCSVVLALPASDDGLLPCGDAFYYPSKVLFAHFKLSVADFRSILAMMEIFSARS